MLISVLRKNDGADILLVGLSYENLRLMKERGPVLVDMDKLGFAGKIVITREIDGKFAVPIDESVDALCFSEGQADNLKDGMFLRLPLEKGGFQGEVILFSAPDERTMEEMLHHFIPPGQGSATCPTCRSGFREDGSCNCESSLH